MGHSCGVLSFAPSPKAPAYQGLVYRDAGHSWGGSVVEHGGRFHMYAGDFYNGLDYGDLKYRVDYAARHLFRLGHMCRFLCSFLIRGMLWEPHRPA
jgi:hypothetical protein